MHYLHTHFYHSTLYLSLSFMMHRKSTPISSHTTKLNADDSFDVKFSIPYNPGDGPSHVNTLLGNELAFIKLAQIGPTVLLVHHEQPTIC